MKICTISFCLDTSVAIAESTIIHKDGWLEEDLDSSGLKVTRSRVIVKSIKTNGVLQKR